MADTTKRIFQIHLVDIEPMPEAPPDPTPQFVSDAAQGFINKINGEVEHLLADLRRQLADALVAVEGWRLRATALDADRQAEHEAGCMWANDAATKSEELTTARAENERLRGELELAKASARMGRVELARVAAERDVLSGVRESLRLCRRELSEVDRKLRDANADRDRAIAERDEARKALEMSRATVAEVGAERDQAVKRSVLLQTRLAAQVEKTNECTRALNAHPGVAELAALRARVAELEAELADRSARMTAGAPIKDLEFLVAVPATRFDAMRARIDELEKAIEAAKVNPLTLFNGIDADSRVHPIDARRSFVGLVVDIGCGAGVVPGAIKMLAAWL